MGTGNETALPKMLDLQVTEDRSAFITFNHGFAVFRERVYDDYTRVWMGGGCKCQLSVKIFVFVNCQLYFGPFVSRQLSVS